MRLKKLEQLIFMRWSTYNVVISKSGELIDRKLSIEVLYIDLNLVAYLVILPHTSLNGFVDFDVLIYFCYDYKCVENYEFGAPLAVLIWFILFMYVSGRYNYSILKFEFGVNCLDRRPVRSYFDMIINYLLDRQKEHSRQNQSYFCDSILFNYAIAEGV